MIRMKILKVLTVILFVFLVFCCSICVSAENKTDVKIITRLSGGGLFTPALARNNSLVYNNFEFHLYSNTNNTTYEIRLNNNTIKLGMIINFKDVFHYKMILEYIDLLEVNISNHTYSYSNIHVIAYSVYNRSRDGDVGEKMKYTEKDFEDMIAEIETRSFFSNLLGVFLAGGVVYYYVTEYKKYVPEVIA